MTNILVGQSGGPSPVVNSSLFGVIDYANSSTLINKVYGMVNGIQGFSNEKYFDINQKVDRNSLELLKTTPCSYLGSCRYELSNNFEDPVYDKLFTLFNKLNISCVFYIGGNDSMDTVSKLSRYATKISSDVKFIGVPKTIDNDLVLTDHTPGFGSCAKYIATSVREMITDTSVFETKSLLIIEIMGRHAGWLTAASALARRFKNDSPDLIYLPEINFDIEDFFKRIEKLWERKNALVVCISEGINDKNNRFICEYDTSAGKDSFGHTMLSGAAAYLKKETLKRFPYKVRHVELSIAQRCSSTLISKTDRDEAIMAGRYAVEKALEGNTGYMVAFNRSCGDKYSISCSLKDVNNICNKEKKIPTEMIDEIECDVNDNFVNYCKPLIKGDIAIPKDEYGIPKLLYR